MGEAVPPTSQRAARPEVGVYGLALVAGGAALLLVSFLTLSWYAVGTPGNSSLRFSFDRLHGLSGAHSALPDVTRTYFGWLAWTLLAAVVVLGVLAALPTRLAQPARWLGLLAGAFGASMTYFAFDRLNGGHGVSHARPGVWLALAGFALAALGAVVGPTVGRADR